LKSLIEKLIEYETWQDYLTHKCAQGQLTGCEEAELRDFVESRAWLEVAERLQTSDGKLSIPEKRLINKLGKSSKRVVYSFTDNEQQVLKVLAWLLYAYDEAQPPHCYSFRRGYGAHRAIRQLTSLPRIDSLYCYKLDIQDYFNSINTEMLLPILGEVFSEDTRLYNFFKELLTADEAIFQGEHLSEKRGAMAGTPTAPFLANLYLKEMDCELAARAAAYARYSDDIIIFAESPRQLAELSQRANELLAEHGLKSNPQKERYSAPGEAWEFLGISYQQGVIDLSEATQNKLKGKIHRKARALRRWMLRKDATWERATAAMIRSVNRKFFEGGSTHELTWSRWFFPLINTSKSLAAIDAYLQQELRTIPTGKHTKKNYGLRYQTLKELGYRSLVHEYYEYGEQKKELPTRQPGGKSGNGPVTRCDRAQNGRPDPR
jgi:hypothetical protein